LRGGLWLLSSAPLFEIGGWMKFEECKIGDKVKIAKGIYSGQQGEINGLADKNVNFPIGVNMAGNGFFSTWFEPDALEKTAL